MQPIPILHGMTVGEYAKMLNGEKWLANKAQCDLSVIACINYDRRLPFGYEITIPPSPNLRTMNAIHLYAGLCLFEGTAISLGRGTDKPFEIYGHPSFTKTLPYSFTPRSMPGAKSPVLMDSLCYGYDYSHWRKMPVGGVNVRYLINAYKLFPKKINSSIRFSTNWPGMRFCRSRSKRECLPKRSTKAGSPALKGLRK